MPSLNILRSAVILLLTSANPVLSAPFPFSQYVNGNAPSVLFPNSNTSLSAPPTLGAVSSESALCSSIGTSLLQRGGNAADALVGTAFCIGVVAMYHAGIGGGGFALVRSANGSQYEAVDFRETAPAGSSVGMFKGRQAQWKRGGLAVAVPGEVKGLGYLHNKYGQLPWEEVLAPAVKVARDGWFVGQDLARYMQLGMEDSERFLETDPVWAKDFAPAGRLIRVGERIVRTRYADALAEIARNGPEAFYSGRLAESMVDAVKAKGGNLTMQDLKDYKIEIREAQEIGYRGYRLHSCPAPASGGVALAIMKIIEGYPDFGEEKALNLSTHRLDQAMRFGYGMRTELGDPAFVPGVDEFQTAMISSDAASLLRSRISSNTTHAPTFYDPKAIEIVNTPGTSAIVAADRSGLALSLTTTINLYFGSHVMDPATGIILNNQMNDFSIPDASNAFGYAPAAANFIRPGKRPLSSIAPVIIDRPDGSLYLVLASAGGSRIVSAVVQGLWNVLDRGRSAPEALRLPRLHDQLVPDRLLLEYGYDNATAEFLRERGHSVEWIAPGLSSAQAIRRLDNGTWEAAGEPRQVDSGGLAV